MCEIWRTNIGALSFDLQYNANQKEGFYYAGNDNGQEVVVRADGNLCGNWSCGQVRGRYDNETAGAGGGKYE